ncbi:hypothetical protein CIY_34170 [Butyrivibrio fibrisolvens 16/4]|nr:hypothetical protein CIY_34170 [Butyrivibrio fibrisolvens 16/4]
MEFSIYTEKVINASYEMQSECKSIEHIIDIVDEVNKQLQEFSGLGDLHTPISKVLLNLEEEVLQVKQLSIAINKIAFLYDRTELQIVENTEDEKVLLPRKHIQRVDINLSEIQAIEVRKEVSL